MMLEWVADLLLGQVAGLLSRGISGCFLRCVAGLLLGRVANPLYALGARCPGRDALSGHCGGSTREFGTGLAGGVTLQLVVVNG